MQPWKTPQNINMILLLQEMKAEQGEAWLPSTALLLPGPPYSIQYVSKLKREHLKTLIQKRWPIITHPEWSWLRINTGGTCPSRNDLNPFCWGGSKTFFRWDCLLSGQTPLHLSPLMHNPCQLLTSSKIEFLFLLSAWLLLETQTINSNGITERLSSQHLDA